MSTAYTHLSSPVGPVRVVWSDEGLRAVHVGSGVDDPVPEEWILDRRLRCEATEQLKAYFRRELETFDVPLVLAGTPFQRQVWQTLAAIPFGTTISYAEMARRVGRPRAVRAVGAANGRNPIPIILPCHRVIGSGGELRGYAGGLDVKEKLLLHEGLTLHNPTLF